MIQEITKLENGTATHHPICPGWEWVDGAFRPCDSIPLTDRAFRYGMSLFESILVRNETPLFLLGHLSRLVRGCEQRGFPIPDGALERIEELLRCSGVNGLVRIYVTAGDGGVTDPMVPRLFVFAEPRAAISEKMFETGYSLTVERRQMTPVFAGLKTGNYWLNIDSLSAARQNGADEALLFNARNLLISACMANVFLVYSGKIHTPALACGARDGVIREWVLRHGSVEEAALNIRDIESAEEIFLTNSWIGIMPVHSLEGRALVSREITRQLHGAYQAEIASSAG